jgi:hypothetical protein
MLTRSIVAPLIVLSAILVSACDSQSPTAPSRPPASPPSPPVPVTDTWDITVRLTGAAGGECVGETMQSQIGVPKSYTLSITSKGSTANVTLRSVSGDYVCTFPGARVEDDSFTTFGVNGWMSCETSGVVRGFACANGRSRDMLSLGEDISGHISENQITGQWSVSWVVMEAGGDLGGRDDIAGLETTSHYTGSR